MAMSMASLVACPEACLAASPAGSLAENQSTVHLSTCPEASPAAGPVEGLETTLEVSPASIPEAGLAAGLVAGPEASLAQSRHRTTSRWDFQEAGQAAAQEVCQGRVAELEQPEQHPRLSRRL